MPGSHTAKRRTKRPLWQNQPIVEQLPSWSFGGKGISRSMARQGSGQTGPGPGQYELAYDYAAACAQPRREHFGRSQRAPLSEVVYGPGPGANDHGVPMLAGHEGPGSTFGPHNVTERAVPKWMAQAPPGPGDYNLASSIGVQHCYASLKNKVSPPTWKFSQDKRSFGLLQGLEDTPGVKYATIPASMSNQVLSGKPTAPCYSVGTKLEVGSMYYKPGALDMTQPKREKSSTQELMGTVKTVQQSNFISDEIALFPARHPIRPYKQRAAKEAWGFASSGFKNAGDEELEKRVRKWCKMESMQWTEAMKRVDIMDRGRARTRRR